MPNNANEKRHLIQSLSQEFIANHNRCEYCGITDHESEILYNHYPECTRGGKRGKSLEWDRKDPFQPYSNIENLVKACYWCNNAKTNYFTFEEFKEKIGPIIGAVNRERLAEIRRNMQ